VLAVDLQLGGEEWILVRSGVKILSVLALLVQTYNYWHLRRGTRGRYTPILLALLVQNYKY
jgi:hypothetical protein